MKSTAILSALLFAAAGMLSPCAGAEFPLTQDGKSVCVIVAPDPGTVVSDFAAKELSAFLGKISGGEKPAIVKGKNTTSLYPVVLNVDEKAATSAEGYIIDAGEKGITITSRHPRGILYGVFALLKESTGIRWVFPGADGEYFKVQPDIKVKDGVRKGEPSFSYRTLSLHTMGITSPAKDTRDWMVRNGLQLHTMPFLLSEKFKTLARILEERGVHVKENLGFTSVFTGLDPWSGGDKLMAEWFKTDKELFPLINGKRVCLKEHAYQPCTSNPETIRRSVEGLIKSAGKTLENKEAVVDIFNNDGTGWCQCENCRKQDSEYDKKMGYVSNRFWKYFLPVCQKVLERYPDARINGMAYQNFEAPPSFQIDKRFGATLSFNRLCYRHKIDDPECLTNGKFLDFHKGWEKQGIWRSAREEMGCAGMDFQPVGPNYVHLLKFYKKMGVAGNCIAVAPPDGWYPASIQKYGDKQWRGMWQAIYLHAIYTWNIDADYEKEWEEMNSLYYGKAWEGGMKEFFKLLWETASGTPGCYGHAYSAPLGRCLDKPLAQEKLNQYLASAIKAAEKDPDPRALAHVKFDAQHFKDTWEFQRKHYVETYRELRAYEKTAPIVIDGKLDEKDWKNADVITNFKSTFDVAKPAKYQTFVRVVYEPEYLYFAAEMAEPEIDKVKTTITERDGRVWSDNTIELFLSHPDLAVNATFFHFIFNTDGVFYDRKVIGTTADASFNSSLEVKTRREADRWVLEAKIPTAELGEKCFTGQSWKMNVMRARLLAGSHEAEGSTLSGGQPFDTGSFLSVSFAGKRTTTTMAEGDSRQWANGSFNEPAKKPQKSFKDGKAPSGWYGGKLRPDGELEWIPIAPGSPNYAVHGKNCRIYNNIGSRAKKFTVHFRYKGKGDLGFYVYRYDGRKGTPRATKTACVLSKVDAADWTSGKFEFDNPAEDDTERQVLAVHLYGDFFIDEIYLAPVSE